MWRARIDPSRPLPLQFCQRSLAPSSSIHKHRSLGLDCFQADSPNVLLMDTTTSNWKLSEPVPLDLLVPMDLKDRNLSPQELISKSIAAMREWIAAQPQKSPKSKSTRRPPPPPICDCLATTTLCYTDAAWKIESKAAGLAWIFNRGTTAQDHVSSAIMAEALAIRGALLHAISLNITHIWIRSDSQALIRAITSRRHPSGRALWSAVRYRLISFLCFFIVFSLSFHVCTTIM